MIYEGYKVFGPYKRKTDSYQHVVLYKSATDRLSVSYAKYLLEMSLGRYLEPNEDAHHKDENPENNDLSNLEVKTRLEHIRHHFVKHKDNVRTNCAGCGVEFELTPKQQRARRKNTSGPFCSRSCIGKNAKRLRGRASGQRNGRSKLDEEKVREIRKSQSSDTALAKIYGVDRSTIKAVRSGRSWKPPTK